MSKNHRSYNQEFIQESVTYAISAPSITGAAKELGIPESTLHTWIKKAERLGNIEVAPNQNINISDTINELKALKRKVAVLEQEKAILKKAATYFAKELG